LTRRRRIEIAASAKQRPPRNDRFWIQRRCPCSVEPLFCHCEGAQRPWQSRKDGTRSSIGTCRCRDRVAAQFVPRNDRRYRHCETPQGGSKRLGKHDSGPLNITRADVTRFLQPLTRLRNDKKCRFVGKKRLARHDLAHDALSLACEQRRARQHESQRGLGWQMSFACATIKAWSSLNSATSGPKARSNAARRSS